jgi:excisionase family DNA binding protein
MAASSFPRAKRGKHKPARNKLRQAPQISPQALTITPRQVMAVTNLGRTKVHELIRNGTLASCKVGKSRLVFMDSVNALLANGRGA